jgi:hypothetical protein
MFFRWLLIITLVVQTLNAINPTYFQGRHHQELLDTNSNDIDDERSIISIKRNDEDDEDDDYMIKRNRYPNFHLSPLWLSRRTRSNRLYAKPLWISRTGR